MGAPLIRPCRTEDAAGVAAFFASAHRADRSVQFVPVAGWMAFAAYPANRGARDFAVAEAGGRIVGLLTSTLLAGTRRGRRRRHFRIIVHPGFRGRGIGSALFLRLEGQPVPGPRPVLQSLCPGTWTLALRFLRHRGFERVHVDREMERTGRSVPPARPPAGILLRPFGRRGDFDAWIRLHAEGYRADFHFDPMTRAAIRAERRAPGSVVVVAEEGGRPVGIVLGRDHGKEDGTIQSLLVAKRRRRAGIGRALLRAALEDFRARGKHRVTLGVSSGNPPAIRLYASEGFRRVREDLTFWRDA
jgi:mycothiol synthase